MRKTGRKKPPSRARYEQMHPTVSFRVDRETYETCKAGKHLNGMSFADIFKVGAGILELRVKEEEEIREEAFSRGYSEGYEEAESLYKVIYPCSVCKLALVVTTDVEKQAIKRYMQENGWGHKKCHERRR